MNTRDQDIRTVGSTLGLIAACIGAGLLWGWAATLLVGGVLLWNGAK